MLNLIDRLPPWSDFAAAVADDDEHAEMLLEAHGDSAKRPAYSPPLTSWTPEVAQLVNIVDLMKNLINVTAQSAGGKPERVKPSPRPITAVDRERREKAERAYLDLAAILIPDG